MGVTNRALRHEDAADLHANCFSTMTREEVEERVAEDVALQEAGEGLTLVAEEDGRVGAQAKLIKSGEAGWIFNVIAHPDFRGRGIVQEILRGLEEHARGMKLVRLAVHVRADNPAAIKTYEKAGFKYAGADGMGGAQLRYEKLLTL